MIPRAHATHYVYTIIIIISKGVRLERLVTSNTHLYIILYALPRQRRRRLPSINHLRRIITAIANDHRGGERGY